MGGKHVTARRRVAHTCFVVYVTARRRVAHTCFVVYAVLAQVLEIHNPSGMLSKDNKC